MDSCFCLKSNIKVYDLQEKPACQVCCWCFTILYHEDIYRFFRYREETSGAQLEHDLVDDNEVTNKSDLTTTTVEQTNAALEGNEAAIETDVVATTRNQTKKLCTRK